MQVTRDEKEYTVADGHEWFWKIFADKSWEPETFRIFDKFLDRSKNFLDIGAWIGPTTLYASPKAKQVFSFEPDPVAYRSLVQNLQFNKAENVVPYPVAVSNKWQGLNFGVKNALGDSMSSQIWGKKGEMEVPAVPLGALIEDIQPNFIKIDIEGGEKFIFQDSRIVLKMYKPTIHLSLHTPWFKDDVESFAFPIIDVLKVYPYFYDQNLNPIELESAFDENAFNSIIATFEKI